MPMAVLLCWALLFTSTAQAAEPPDADAIMARSYSETGGNDGVARMTFVFKPVGKPSQTVRYAMAWKQYDAGQPYLTKVLVFPEFPPTKKGIGYMGWIRPAASKLPNEEWIYLPEMRAVRKLTHKGHNHDDPEDEFRLSVLKTPDMVPRPPELDRHRYLRDESIDGVAVAVIESTPKVHDHDYPYHKATHWIAKADGRPLRRELHGADGPVKRIHFTWQRQGDQWVWHTLVGEDLTDGNITELTMSDYQLGKTIDERTFSQRSLKAGSKRLF